MRKLATIREVRETRPIDGADAIELAVVDGWKCVTKKGEFAAGDAVIYCEIDSFLPVRDEFEFLRKSSLKVMDDREIANCKLNNGNCKMWLVAFASQAKNWNSFIAEIANSAWLSLAVHCDELLQAIGQEFGTAHRFQSQAHSFVLLATNPIA